MSTTEVVAGSDQDMQSHSTWPALPWNRTWTPLSLLAVCVSFAAATWAFPVGGVIALFLPADLGLAALIAGTVAASVMVAVAAGPVAAKYGIDTVMSTRAQLGRHGSYITMTLILLSAVGWNSILLILLGRSGAEILISIGLIGEDARYAARIVITIAAILFVVFILRGGASNIERVGKWIAGLVFVLGTWILVVMISEVGWDTIMAARPPDAYPKQSTNYMVGLDIGLAPQLSFLPYLGALARLVPGMRRATWPIIFGLATPMIYLAAIGLFAGLAVPNSVGDPSVFLVEVAGTPTAVALLIFTILTNVGTVAIGTYVAVVGIRAVPAVEHKLSWGRSALLVLLPVLILTAIWPDDIYDNVGKFMAFLGVAFAPLAGVMIADFHFLRRQRIDLAAIFDRDAARAYNYWHGFNPAGIAGLLAGSLTYLYLLDPYHLTVREPFSYISAGIPSSIVAAVVFLLVTRLVIRRGLGGYGDPTERSSA